MKDYWPRDILNLSNQSNVQKNSSTHNSFKCASICNISEHE